MLLEMILMLKHLNISLDFGRIKNSNKNPVVEKCVRELGTEILHFNLDGGPINNTLLAHEGPTTFTTI